MKDLEKFIMKALDLHEGDIVVMEMPYEDAQESDFFPFNKPKNFKAGHVAVWVAGDKPAAHSTREGYRLPGLRLTNLHNCRAMVYRFKSKALAENAAKIIKTWSLASTQLDLKSYMERYPEKEWSDRHQQDVTNFFTPDTNYVNAPATPYLESKAAAELRELHKDSKKAELSQEGVRRAIKFAARREIANEGISKGQRCTSAVVAAFQSSLLAEVIKTASKSESKKIKGQDFNKCSQTLFKPGWEKSDVGQRLLEAIEKKDFSHLFPKALNVDQRYATPKTLHENLSQDESFEYVGRFSVFEDRAEVTDNKDTVLTFPTKMLSLK